MVVEHAHGLRQRRGPNAKSSLHKAHLAPDAGLQAPGASLSFAQGSHDFESLDRGIGRGDRFETAHRLDQYLELSVIGLDHVIEILHLPVGRLPVQLSFALQFGDRCTIARRFVGIERGRLFPVLQASQGLAQEPLRCLGAAGRRQVEIDRVAPLVDCPVQVGPLAPHLDVGFIQAPARIKATPPEPAQPLLHLRGVALDPAIDRRMVDRNAAFRQHFLKVAIADRIATIPAHRPQDHITLEMAPLEIRHRSVRPISAKHAQASRFLQQSQHYHYLVEQIKDLESQLKRKLDEDEVGQRLLSIPCVGTLTASTISTEIGDGKQYASSRDFAAATGLVPRQYSTGGRTTLLGISKRGNKKIRTLLVQCARVFIQKLEHQSGKLADWVRDLLCRKSNFVVTCALANKLARIAWALTARQQTYVA